jgi:hypothetical protein
MLSNEVLHPDTFPWQSFESGMVGAEFKAQVEHLLSTSAHAMLNEATQTMQHQQDTHRRKQARLMKLQQHLSLGQNPPAFRCPSCGERQLIADTDDNMFRCESCEFSEEFEGGQENAEPNFDV